MKVLTYTERGKFALLDKPAPRILDSRDAIVRVTLGSICTSDLHVKHGSVPRHGKVLLCACFFTESTLEKCYDVSTH